MDASFRFRIASAVALALLLASGCESKDPVSPSTSSPVPEVLDSRIASLDPDICRPLATLALRLIARAPKNCTDDDECDFYRGGVLDCGGVLDTATVANVARLIDVLASSCPLVVGCAPRIGYAACVNFRCVEVDTPPAKRNLDRPRPTNP